MIEFAVNFVIQHDSAGFHRNCYVWTSVKAFAKKRVSYLKLMFVGFVHQNKNTFHQRHEMFMIYIVEMTIKAD